jgi:hypothetical protein
MATDFTKEVESSISDVKNFGNALKDISKTYQKSLDEIGKKSKEIPKSWGEITQKLKESLTPSGFLSKNISDISKKIEAGKVKQSSLTSEIQKNAEKRRTIESTINKIGEESNEIINVARMSGRKLTGDEKNRLQILSGNESKLRITSAQLLAQQKISGQQVKSEKEKNDKLQAQINTLQIISTIYDSTKAVIIGLITLGETYDKVLMGFAHSLGTGRIEAEKYVPALTRSAQKSKALGASLIDTTAAATQLVNQFELMANSALDEVNYQMMVLNKAFGVSLEDGAKFYATLTQVGNASLSSQTNMTGVADAAAKAAGVPLGRVIKDVANISDGVRLIFRGNTEQLIKQAAEARKLGTSLDSAAKSAESLLNFESSVANELKLSALLGKNVNFNESRRLFFAGKTVEAEKAILSELNNIGDINELNYLQRKALSDLTGKSFGELQKIQAQTKQQLDLDSKFPEYAAERLQYEIKLKEISGSELKQKQQAEEMAKRDNIANARANVFLKQKEEILLNLSRAIQPLYRDLMDLSEGILDVIIKITDWMAETSKSYPILSEIGVVVGIVAVGVVGLAAAIGTLILTMFGLTALGIEISAFLTEVSIGLASFGFASLAIVPVILSIAAAIAAIGYAAPGIGKIFEGLGSLIRSILEPIVKFIDVIITGFNTFISNIGTSMVNVAAGLKSITDIGFTGLASSAAGVGLMANSIVSLGLALALFPTDKLTGFATDFVAITNINTSSLNKLTELFESATSTGGKLMIGIEDEAVASINKLSDLKGERDELKQTIRETNDRLVKSVENLTSMMANGGIAVNLDGQRVTAALSKTTYRSGGFGQSTSLA